MYVDSLDKVFSSYIAGVCDEEVHYKKLILQPKSLRVSKGLFRGFTCPSMCAGCCPQFSLDYLPSEDRPVFSTIQPRIVCVNGKEKVIFSDFQEEYRGDHFCRHVNKENGRCEIHGLQPFTCDFELIRFAISTSLSRPNQMNQRLFGRGWSFLTVEGKRGAKCSITSITKDTIQDTLRRLKRLLQWCKYFEIQTCLPVIIDYAEKGIHHFPLFLPIGVDGKRVLPRKTFW